MKKKLNRELVRVQLLGMVTSPELLEGKSPYIRLQVNTFDGKENIVNLEIGESLSIGGDIEIDLDESEDEES